MRMWINMRSASDLLYVFHSSIVRPASPCALKLTLRKLDPLTRAVKGVNTPVIH
jgi:hypothetical protein